MCALRSIPLSAAYREWLREYARDKNFTVKDLTFALSRDPDGSSRPDAPKYETVRTWLTRGLPEEPARWVAETLDISLPTETELAEYGFGADPGVVPYSQTRPRMKVPTRSEATLVSNEDDVYLVISSLNPSAGPGSDANGEILSQVKVPASWIQGQYPQIQNLSTLALCRPRGDSMATTFTAHDTLVVDRGVTRFESDSIYVFTYNDELRVKRIQRQFDGGVLILSDNLKYKPDSLTKEQLANVRVHGRVVGKWTYEKM